MGVSEQVSASLLRQLQRLEEVDGSDPDALKAEIDRGRAMQGIASTLVANGNMVLDACRMRADLGEAARVPKGLVG